jgi:DNA anti-recombination protein RmuC
MAESARINPEVLREVASHHDSVADTIAEARQAGDDINAAVQTYGPIMHQVKSAVGDLLAEREQALRSHDEAHRSVADKLRRHASEVVEVEAENVRGLTL